MLPLPFIPALRTADNVGGRGGVRGGTGGCNGLIFTPPDTQTGAWD